MLHLKQNAVVEEDTLGAMFKENQDTAEHDTYVDEDDFESEFEDDFEESAQDSEAAAARRIQCVHRGRAARIKASHLRQASAATRIQALQRRRSAQRLYLVARITEQNFDSEFEEDEDSEHDSSADEDEFESEFEDDFEDD